MSRIACAVLLLGSSLVSQDKHGCVVPKPALDGKFHPGQVWEYRSRPEDKKSTLTILRVESLPEPVGTTVHVRVDGIRLRNCTGGPEPDNIEHMPFTKDALDRSVTKLILDDSKLPDYSAGYQQWSHDCGGVYTITVAEAIAADQLTFSKSLGCATESDSTNNSSAHEPRSEDHLENGAIIDVGAEVVAPKAISTPNPEYPETARKDKIEGTVILSTVIGADGRVLNARVKRSIRRDLDEAAVQAVNAWIFEPAVRNGKPVPSQVNLEITFHLEQSPATPEK